MVELLVVMGVISILASMLLPALSSSKSTARRIQCLSNLSQMAIASHVYGCDNLDAYPMAYYDATVSGVHYSYAWDFTVVQGATNQVIPGLLWQGQCNLQVQQCPSFTGAANWKSDPYTGYNYNTSYIGHGEYEDISQPARESDVLHSAKTVLFGDGQYADGADKFMRAPFPNPGDAGFNGRWSGTQGFRHQNRTTSVFCDGHAESLSNRFTDNADGAANVADGTGFLSADNSAYDLQ